MPGRRSRHGGGTSHWSLAGDEDFKRFTRSLAQTPRDMARAERTFLVAAARTASAMAKADALSEGGVAAKSAADVRTGGPGVIVYGGNGYNMGAEFGSYRYKQFKTWRGNGDDAGYFLWPSIRLFRSKAFEDLWTREVWRVVHDDFIK